MKLVQDGRGAASEAVATEHDAVPDPGDARRLRVLFDQAEVGVLVEDAAGGLLYANDALARLLGFADAVPMRTAGTMLEFLHDDERRRWLGYGLARRGGAEAPSHYRVCVRHVDGGTRVLHNVVTPVRWEGRFATQGVLVDVTEEAGAAEALAEAERRYRLLAEATAEWYWETDAELRMTHLSRSSAPRAKQLRSRTVGYRREELIDPAGTDPEAHARHLEDLAQRRPFRDFVHKLTPAISGPEDVYLRVSGVPCHDAGGAFLGYCGTGTNITREVLARERAHTAEQRLAQALQSISEAFVLFDAEARLVICNGAYRDLYPQALHARVIPGARFEDLARLLVATGCFGDTAGREEDWLAKRLADFRTGHGTMEMRRADGGWHRVQHHRLGDGGTILLCTDISELKAREAALEASEARFRDYLASSSDWFWETDAAHRFRYLSPRFTELTGIPRSTFIGRYRGEVAPQGADPTVWQHHLEDLEARRSFRGLRYGTADATGARRHYEVSGVPLFDEDGRFTGYRGTGLDCTAQVQALQARGRYQDAIENLSDGYALFDADDRLLAWNSAWVAFATPQADPTLAPGMRFEDIVRRNVAHGLFPRAAEDPEGWIAERMRLHRECREPFEIHRDNGSWYQVRERRTPDHGTMVTASEITELKRREHALRESEERFRDFAETAADWFFELDADLCFTFVSHRFESLTGIRPASLVGQPLASIAASAHAGDGSLEPVLAAMHAHESLDDLEFEGVGAQADSVVHSISARPVLDAAGRFAGYRGTGRDITQARRLSRQLAWQASHDELTGLVNRREFEKRLSHAVASARDGVARHALCYVDLDQFKVLNDTSGHVAGDELLRRLGRLLKEQVRGRDTLARLGGDEFALLLEHCSLEQAASVAESVRAAVEGFEFAWDAKPFRIGASIGLVPIDGASVDASQALRAADSACYLAKDGGRNRVHVYTPQDRGVVHREGEMHWVTRITGALGEDRLTLLAQPIVPTLRGAAPTPPARHELLLRLRDHDDTLVPPRAFLPAAERYGLANRVDRWVVDHVLYWLTAHHARLAPDSRLCVNLSGQSLNDEEFLAYLDSRLREDATRAGALCFEVTETATIANLHDAREFLGMLRGHGCEIALDDFGTGLSSFACLRDLPVDYLKIDGAFIRGIEHDPVSLSIVRSINEIGHVLGKRTIAEYVENDTVAALVADLGVDFVQGFGVGTPMPLDALLA